ncbi:MAG: S8 family serine peptidase, partial [Candidatus Eisenbacteria bacterium]|nr:S8 family serine peptidase [Candidatus Eisenbacteria bacterium]
AAGAAIQTDHAGAAIQTDHAGAAIQTDHAAPARELIVFLRPTAAGTSATAADRARSFAVRAGALGLSVTRRLDEALAFRAAPTGLPDALDPSRVLLVTAPDSLAAVGARRALDADPDVEWVEPNRVREAAVVRVRPMPAIPTVAPGAPEFPDDPMFRDTRQWALMNLGPAGVMGGVANADIHARAAWAASAGANDVLLAVADTGVDPAQPELQARMPDGGWRLTLGRNVTLDPSPSFADSFGHGTPVAAVMAARTNDGVHFDSLGMAGVCGGDGGANLGCRIVPIKMAPGHTGSATSFDMASAILYATAVGARAVNISFAGAGASRLERLAMLQAITHGCIVVAAAGNRGGRDGGTTPQYPAAYAADGLGIQVGASDRWDRRAAYSSFGPGLDLVAPGDDIWSAWMTYVTPGGAVYPGYALVSGTSFAAPHVTGTLGLLTAARPELMDADFQHIVRESADDIGAPGRDAETGWGRLDAAAALAAVRPALGIWHDEVAADAFALDGPDTLVVTEPGPGRLDRLGTFALERIAVTATVTLPDSFADTVRVWPRIAGTSTMRARAPYWTPWAEVIARGARTFTLRGYIYREPGADSSEWIPLPPDQARFGFTAIGAVRRSSDGVVAAPPPVRRAPRLAASPNPFRASTRIDAPPGSVVRIVDVAGRVVRRVRLDGTMPALLWDGRDERGALVRPGLYLLRCDDDAGTHHAKVVRLP